MKTLLLILLSLSSLLADKLLLLDEHRTYLAAKKQITMCVDPDWEPFEQIITTPKGPLHVGISADIIALIARRLEISIELVPARTWQESIQFSKDKRCDILSFVNQTPVREQWLIFTEPIFRDPNVLVAKQGSKMITDLKSEKLSIAFPRDTAMFERFSKDYPNLVFIPTYDEAEAFTLVAENKADLTLRSLIVTAYTIKKEGLFDLKIVGKPKEYENILRMGVSKEDIMLRDILNLGIATLTQADIDAIVNKHVHFTVEEINYFTVGFYVFLGLLVVIVLIVLWNYTLQRKLRKELRKNEVQTHHLLQKAKQAELSLVIGNISHQFRDALSKLSYINLALMSKLQKKQVIAPEELDSATKQVETSIEFMSDTMHTFLEFYRPTTQKTHFTIFESVQEILVILDTKLKQSNVHVAFSVQDNFSLFGIKNEWMQIWLNLLNNTMHQASKKAIKEVKVRITIDKECIVFEDNCLGFEPDILENLKTGNCERLGLAMCQSILEKYHWKLTFSNTPKGAKVNLYH